MGHMDVEKYTITIYIKEEKELYPSCTEVNNAVEDTLIFVDSTGKRHEVYGVNSYHIVQE